MDFVRSYFGTNEPLTAVEHFCSHFFSRSALIWTKSEEKKCSTGQRFIFIKVTPYKIHTLIASKKCMTMVFMIRIHIPIILLQKSLLSWLKKTPYSVGIMHSRVLSNIWNTKNLVQILIFSFFRWALRYIVYN